MVSHESFMKTSIGQQSDRQAQLYYKIATNGLISENPPPTPSATPSGAVSRFSADLKAMYKCSPISSDKWPPTPSKEYSKLAVVQSRNTCWEDYIGLVLEGNITKVQGRDSITEEQILDLCVQQVGKGRVIVIEGAPGIGKSTLAWELCRKWEEYASMKAYSLVILLRLREKRVQNISDVSSLFYAYQRSDKMSLTDEIQNNQGKGVLFVLDGFDELPKSLQHEGVLVDLLRKSILPKSTVIVTCSSSAMHVLLAISAPVIEKRIEILGFSQESRQAYAASIFSSSKDELEMFKSYISRPAINSLMYVPLYAAFVVIIYKITTSKGTLPHTITQFYTQLCLAILNRYLEANTEYPSVRTIEHLPAALYGQFIELSRLAYEGFEREDVIFYGDIGEHFGFLDVVPDLYGGRTFSYNFLHLTLQEFFAAYHISQMPDNGAELFRTKCRDKRWNVVWRFVAGLTEFKYLDSFSIAAFLFDGKISSLFVQCLFEAHSIKLDFQSTFGSKTMTFIADRCTSFDYYTLGYCIANCTTPESSWKVTLFDYKLNTALETFTQGLMTNKCSTGVITQLHISSQFLIRIPEILHTCIFTATTSPLCSIIDLKMFGAQLSSNKERIHLFELVSHMPHLQRLDISGGNFCNAPSAPYSANRDIDGLLKFLQYLPHSHLTSLNIGCTGLEYFLKQSPLAQDYCAAIQALISPPSNLRELGIGPRGDSCREGNLALISLVCSPSSLRKLSLYFNHGSNLLNAFRTDNHITELELACANFENLVRDLVRVVQHSTALKTLKLYIEVFDSLKDRDALMDIAAALQRNQALRHLYIHLPHSAGDNPQQLERALQAVDSRIAFYT